MCAAHPYRPTAPGLAPGACLSLGRLLVAAALAALWAARPARPRRRAPARGRSRGMRAAGRLPRPALLRPAVRLRAVAAEWRLARRRPRARAPAAARARQPPACPRLRARACSPSPPSGGLRAALRPAPPVALRAVGLPVRSPSLCSGLPAGLRPLRRGPPAARAGAWAWVPRGGSPGGASRAAGGRRSGAVFPAPPGRGLGALRRAAPLRGGGKNPAPCSREEKKVHESGKTCKRLLYHPRWPRAILKLQGAAINLATHVPTMAQGYRLRAALLGGSLLILILYVLFVGEGVNVRG